MQQLGEQIAGVFGFSVGAVDVVSYSKDYDQVLFVVNGILYECFPISGALRTVKEGFNLVDRLGA